MVQQIADERHRNYMTSNNPIYYKPTHMELTPTDDTRILELYDGIHGVNEGKTKSIKRRELLTSLQNELERFKFFGDYEIRQIRRNIKRSMNNGQTDSLQLWLDTIRTVKESEIMLRRETQIHRTRMQSITTYLLRPAHA